MNYTLKQSTTSPSLSVTSKKFWPFLATERKNLLIALFFLLLNSALNLASPLIIGIAIDRYIQTKNYQGVLMLSTLLLCVYLAAFAASYCQTKIIGGVSQRVLFRLRNAVFFKLQELPLAFFTQNKAGDLISRINNDTDRLNQFFTQALMQFIGNIFIMAGAAFFILTLHTELGGVALLPVVALVIFTQLISAWVKKKNAKNLQAVGDMSAEIQESLDNFKVIVAFNRREYFRERFHLVNETNFESATTAGLANNIFTPIYGLAANIAQILVLFFGIYLISTGHLTIGVLISFISYTNRFYDPIRQIAGLWATFQVALASWERISEILAMDSDLPTLAADGNTVSQENVLTFDHVSFEYPDGKDVLNDISFSLLPGKTYALVGPTGGGKTTTASLMARLYDPTEGTILLEGRDIRTFSHAERTKKIGFILQEPFLFTGTVKENILYGNDEFTQLSNEKLLELFASHHFDQLLARFDQGLETVVTSSSDSISLGQRQLIAFMRIVLRDPDLLILDEATANIDTITEQQLDDILKTLPKKTTKVIIAHRLNTIEDADDIFFVNSGEIVKAGSLKHAIAMLLDQKRTS